MTLTILQVYVLLSAAAIHTLVACGEEGNPGMMWEEAKKLPEANRKLNMSKIFNIHTVT
jgi:hypothetical protein